MIYIILLISFCKTHCLRHRSLKQQTLLLSFYETRVWEQLVGQFAWGSLMKLHLAAVSFPPVWMLTRSLISSPCDLSMGHLCVWGFPQDEWFNRKRKVEVTCLYDLASKAILHHIYHVLFLRNESLNRAHTQGEGIISTEGKGIEAFVNTP